MDHHKRMLAVTITALSLAVIVTTSMAQSSPAPPYANHTVGGPAGWFFDSATNSSSANYSTWASNQSFYLGDYLIFKTNTNSTVVLTSNETTYRLCDTSGDDGQGTFIYGGGGNGGAAAAELQVPLTMEGVNYLFSDTNDGNQCFHGMRFQITVAHGRGLPPELNQPPPPPYAGNPPPSAPDTSTTNQGQSFYNGGSRKGTGGGLEFWGLVLGVGVAMMEMAV
ncbi:early nodulin-like protein 18 [Typha latifolia]|uniref:early nodulin-like protein 18 n=1 Tax=Typha latifolia TaxID=4733 RepID=UPI003C2B0190